MKKAKTKSTHHINDPLLTMIQEVYFDICDVSNNQSLTFKRGAEKPEEFENAQEWVEEQKNKLEEIEEMVKALLQNSEDDE